jgi:hypothetical protein
LPADCCAAGIANPAALARLHGCGVFSVGANAKAAMGSWRFVIEDMTDYTGILP